MAFFNQGEIFSNYDAVVAIRIDGLQGSVPFKIESPTSPFGLDVNFVLAPCDGPDGGMLDTDNMTISAGCYQVSICVTDDQACAPIEIEIFDEWSLIIFGPDTAGGIEIESEPNDIQPNRNVFTFPEDEPALYITGKLEPDEFPDCQPDTYLMLFDKQNGRVGYNDNSDCAGNGKGSGIVGATVANGMIIDNLDGSFSLRAGVTGRPDGMDLTFNGLFQNAPHGQLGGWELITTFFEGGGPPPAQVMVNGELMDNPVRHRDAFETGAEAFRVNYVFGPEITSVDLCVDNTVGMVEVCADVDFFEVNGLVPLCDYCIEQVGGIDDFCLPTDTLLGWFDKLGMLITKAESGGLATEWPKLDAVADINGVIVFAVTGADDCDFDGFADDAPAGDPRAPSICPEAPQGHGVCGCYTLRVTPTGPHAGSDDPGNSGDSGASDDAMLDALTHGDLNMDGVTDSADLGILIGSYGWTTP